MPRYINHTRMEAIWRVVDEHGCNTPIRACLIEDYLRMQSWTGKLNGEEYRMLRNIAVRKQDGWQIKSK